MPGGGLARRQPDRRAARRSSAARSRRRWRGCTRAGRRDRVRLHRRAAARRGRPARRPAGDDEPARARPSCAETGAEVIDERVVDDGDVLTAQGVTSGIDLALWLVEREMGAEFARRCSRRGWSTSGRGGVWRRDGGADRRDAARARDAPARASATPTAVPPASGSLHATGVKSGQGYPPAIRGHELTDDLSKSTEHVTVGRDRRSAGRSARLTAQSGPRGAASGGATAPAHPSQPTGERGDPPGAERAARRGPRLVGPAQLAVVPGDAARRRRTAAPRAWAPAPRPCARASAGERAGAGVALDELHADAPTIVDVAVEHHPRLAITPRSSSYASPASTCSVARGSRSRLRTFCDFAYVHAHSSPSRTTYQSGIRCGQPSRPFVAQVTRALLVEEGRAPPRRSCGSASRRLTRAEACRASRSAAAQHRLARVGGLEHGGVAGLLEHLAHEVVRRP